MGSRWSAIAIALLAVVPVAGSALAQNGSKAESIRPVQPAECVAASAPTDTIVTALALDGEGVAAPPVAPIAAPLGEAADPATAISIKETTRELLACINAGDIPRAASLLTTHGMQRAFWRLTVDQTARQATKARLAAKPRPRPTAALIRLIAVTDSSILPDGRVGAFAIINDPLIPPGGQETLPVYYVSQSGRWLIDDWATFAVVPPTGATPVASPTLG
jgi:hypothetical protein